MGQGALGGYLVFESKRLVREFAKSGNYNYVWPSKIVNSAGTSIIENAAANRDFWARWHLNIGFNRIEVNTKENFRVSYRIMPFSLLLTSRNFIRGQIDLASSLRLGTFVFRKDVIDTDAKISGQANGNSIILIKGASGTMALPHELIHVYQFEQFSGINNILSKLEDKSLKKLSLQNLHKLYKRIFYTDYNLPFMYTLYYLANPQENDGHLLNEFEVEAYYFTRIHQF